MTTDDLARALSNAITQGYDNDSAIVKLCEAIIMRLERTEARVSELEDKLEPLLEQQRENQN